MTFAGIDAVTYWLPEHAPTLAELEARGALRGPASTLASFGFERARVAETESHVDMAAHAVASDRLVDDRRSHELNAWQGAGHDNVSHGGR